MDLVVKWPQKLFGQLKINVFALQIKTSKQVAFVLGKYQFFQSNISQNEFCWAFKIRIKIHIVQNEDLLASRTFLLINVMN